MKRGMDEAPEGAAEHARPDTDEESGAAGADDEVGVEKLDDDPAYNPKDPGLRNIKGG
jgi:hypothetical protein